ncbi:hypothetical protein DFJ63DRAFT_316700 [Scheffersomyces coipomensis]|uniref:uncharacterized protein n=1 Tax=Scheffersomyces coipomensis TaxID=1788519 RepID=UPI00315C7253
MNNNCNDDMSVIYTDISIDIYEWLPLQKHLYYFPHLFGNYISKRYFKDHDLLSIYLKFTPHTKLHPGNLTIESCMAKCEWRLGTIFNLYMEEYRWQDFNDSPPLTLYQKFWRNAEIKQIKKRESLYLNEIECDYPDEIMYIRCQLITSILVVHHCPHLKAYNKKDYWKIMRYIQDLIQHLNDERVYYLTNHKSSTNNPPPQFPIEMVEWFDYFIQCDFNKIYEFEPPIFKIEINKPIKNLIDYPYDSKLKEEDTNLSYSTISTGSPDLFSSSPNSPMDSIPTSIPPTTSKLTSLKEQHDPTNNNNFVNKLYQFWDYSYEYYRLKGICGEFESPIKFLKLRKDQKNRKQIMMDWKGSGWPNHILELENDFQYLRRKLRDEYYDLTSFEISNMIKQLKILENQIKFEKMKYPHIKLAPLQLLYPERIEYNELPQDLVKKLISTKDQQFLSPRIILRDSIIAKFQNLLTKSTYNEEIKFESKGQLPKVEEYQEDLINLDDKNMVIQDESTVQNLSSLLNLYTGSINDASLRHISDSTATNNCSSIFSSVVMNDEEEEVADETIDESRIQQKAHDQHSDLVSIPMAVIRAIARDSDLYQGFQNDTITSILEESPWHET